MKPYNCPLCEDGPGFVLEQDRLSREKLDLEQAKNLMVEEEKKIILQQRNYRLQEPQSCYSDEQNDFIKLFQKQLEEILDRQNEINKKLKRVVDMSRKVMLNKKKYATHLKQLETCRTRVIQAAAELQVGECLVYRDFVNQHNEKGRKINNFVLVVLYREVSGGDLVPINISNIIEFDKDGSCDAYFVADVFTFHLKSKEQGGTGLFERFHKIIISGDHGPHFSSAETIYHESTFYAKYKKQIQVLSLCSYHAFNRCDAAGAAVKLLAYQKAKENLALISARDYVFAVREDGQRNAWSYAFDTINRSSNVFDGHGTTDFMPIIDGQKLKLSEMCQLEYCFRDEFGKEAYQEGIVLARPIIGESVVISPKQEFYVLDVSKDSKVRGFCQTCSNQNQRPIYHSDAKCTNLSFAQYGSGNGGPGLFATMNLNAIPQDRRLLGIQLTKAQKAAEKLTRGKFPCRFENCSFQFYDHAWQANKHMSGKEHRYEAEETRKKMLYSKDEAEKLNLPRKLKNVRQKLTMTV